MTKITKRACDMGLWFISSYLLTRALKRALKKNLPCLLEPKWHCVDVQTSKKVPHCTCLWGTSFRRNVHLWLNICIVDDTLRDEALLRSFREVVYGITMYTITKSVFHALPATREGTAQANTAGTYATRVTCKPLFCFIGPEYHRARGKQRGSTCN